MDVQVLRPAVTLKSITKRRFPCATLLGFAIGGILLGDWTPVTGWIWAALAFSCGIFALAERFRGLAGPTIAFAFAALCVWQGRESTATRFAQALGSEVRLAPVFLRIDESPEPAGGGVRPKWRMRATAEIQLDGEASPVRLPVLLNWKGEPPPYGAEVSAVGLIQNLSSPRNPGEFDAKSFYRLRGILTEITVDGVMGYTVTGNSANPIVALAIHSKAQIKRILSIGIQGTVESAVILGMTIGDTSGAPDALAEDFRKVGVFHLFSVSGLHVAMIAAMLWFGLGVLGFSRRRAAAVLIPCVFFYALITGWSPPSVRAATMVALVAGGLLFHRHPMPLNSLCAAAILLLTLRTSDLFNPGFQLSFLVVATILLLAAPISRGIERLVEPDPFIPRQLLPRARTVLWEVSLAGGGLLAVSLAAWLGSLPLIIGYFSLISPAAIPANLIIVPLAFVSLALAAASLATGWITPLLADLFNHANFAVTHGIIALTIGFTEIPGGHFYVGPPMDQETLAEVTVFDAEAGGAIVIQTHDGFWLIDGGSRHLGENAIPRFLRSRGANRISGVFLSHGDARHLAGIRALMDAFHIENAWESSSRDKSTTRKALRSELLLAGTHLHTVSTGDVIALDDLVRVDVLYPPKNLDEVYADDETLVLKLQIGAAHLLLLSDAGHHTESWLLTHALDALPAEVLVKGQHQTGLSGSEEFLNAVDPEVLIQSVNSFPDNEQLNPEWAASIQTMGIQMLPQSETGAVTIRILRNGIALQPFLQDADEIYLDLSPNQQP